MKKILKKIGLFAVLLLLPSIASSQTKLPEIMVGQTRVDVSYSDNPENAKTFYGGIAGNETVVNYDSDLYSTFVEGSAMDYEYNLFGFDKDYLQGNGKNLIGCVNGILMNVPNAQDKCFVSNNRSSNNIAVMNSRTYIDLGGSDTSIQAVNEIAALFYSSKPFLMGDANLGSMDPDNFAYWGRNLTQSTKGVSEESFIGVNTGGGYNYNPDAQAKLSGKEYEEYKTKINLYNLEATAVTNSTLLSTKPWRLQTKSSNDIANNSDGSSKYPEGRIWKTEGALNLGQGSTYKYDGLGTLIINGDLNIGPNTTILPNDINDPTSRLGIIVKGNVTIGANCNIKSSIVAAGSRNSPGKITISGNNVNLVGSFVAFTFAGLNNTYNNVRFYYDPANDSNWPPGFRDLKIPYAKEQ